VLPYALVYFYYHISQRIPRDALCYTIFALEYFTMNMYKHSTL